MQGTTNPTIAPVSSMQMMTIDDSQKKNTNPPATLASAHHGVARGLPRYAIWAQSNVTRLMPRPETYPNSWLTTILFGAIQQTQEK